MPCGSEEECRRCIILGICGPGGGAPAVSTDRRDALAEKLAEQADDEARLDYVLGLIDQAKEG